MCSSINFFDLRFQPGCVFFYNISAVNICGTKSYEVTSRHNREKKRKLLQLTCRCASVNLNLTSNSWIFSVILYFFFSSWPTALTALLNLSSAAKWLKKRGGTMVTRALLINSFKRDTEGLLSAELDHKDVGSDALLTHFAPE